MRKFKRAAVLGATLLAFSGAAAGVSQAATVYQTETPGNIMQDCYSAQTAREIGQGRAIVVDYCEQEDVGAGSTPTMMVYWHYA
ncbi:hypothetical protein ACFV3R_24805 [Streptomyces sp. NPDC059740]|uniref:hypothetical protein n=1 Tax=Streptomyces sp. NPDC059740 TaxID=3346926 RepID=UPI003667E0DC